MIFSLDVEGAVVLLLLAILAAFWIFVGGITALIYSEYWMDRFLAWSRLSMKAVCKMSTHGRDYHDYPDSTTPSPVHCFVHTCSRCGKRFTI